MATTKIWPVYDSLRRVLDYANNPEKTTSKINALKKVRVSDMVPLPIDWKRFPARIPNGIKRRKKHSICRQSTTLADKTAALFEYEKMNDKGSANTNKNAVTTTEDIKPSFTP